MARTRRSRTPPIPCGRIACPEDISTPTRFRGRPARFRSFPIREIRRPPSAARRIRPTAPGPIGRSFANRGTSQPKFDARVDQELANGGRLTYEGGVAGTQGIIYTGIGPFDIQSGSYLGFGRVNYSKRALKANFFVNVLNADAPNLLFPDPATGKPLQLTFTTSTYDFEAGDARPIGRHQVVSFGGNIRRNNFDITLAPSAQDRNEVGGYVQDEIAFGRFRFNIGGRVDKFGNLADPVFSPRLAALFKLLPDQSLRVSFNRAFRSPSVINNYLEANVMSPTDLSALAPLLPPALRPAVATPFPLVVRAVGSELPIGATPQPKLTEESLTAYEVAYTGTFANRTTVGLSFYVNDLNNSINFVQLPPTLDPYTAANPPPGWPLPPSILAVMAQRGHLPAENGVHVSESRSAAPEGRRDLARPPGQPRPDGVRELLVAGPADDPRRSQAVSDAGARLSADEPLQRRLQLRRRPHARQRVGELLGQVVLERRAHQPVPRLQRRLHDGERQRRREMDEGPGDGDGQGDQPVQPGHPAARLRRHPEAVGGVRGADSGL